MQDEEEESELGMTELLALKEEKEKKRKEEEEMRKKKEEAEKEAAEEKERARGVSWGMEVVFFITVQHQDIMLRLNLRMSALIQSSQPRCYVDPSLICHLICKLNLIAINKG